MSRKLIVSDGRRQRELLLVSKIVVGRDPTCDLSEADPLLSRRHAEFAIAGEETIVRDLGSRNGIYINGARTAEGTLQSGDVVRVGHLVMRYIEDSAPLVAVPELVDDATGLVIPGPRPVPAKPPPAAPPISSVGASGAKPRPAAPLGSKPQPVPTPPPATEADADVTSYVSPSAIRKPLTGVSGSAVKKSQPAAAAPSGSAAQPAPPAGDEVEPTRVVPAPGRSGLRPPVAPAAKSGVQPSAAAPGTSVLPPPVPLKDEEPTSYVTPRPRTSVPTPPLPERTLAVPPPAPLVEHTAVQAPPAPLAAMHTAAVQPPPVMHTAVLPPPAPAVVHTAVQPPPLPPAEDMDEPTSVILMPRARARDGSAAGTGSAERVLQARALALAVQAIVTFLGSSPEGQRAADAVRLLERDLAGAAPPAALVNALTGLAARVSAAANELP